MAYAPLLWEDYDWDQVFLYDMMILKLNRMETAISSGYHVNGPHIASSQIKVARLALERLRNDNYLADEYLAHYNKYPLDFVRIDNKYSTMKEYGPEERKKANALHKREEVLKKQDFELFCKMFKKSRGWWD